MKVFRTSKKSQNTEQTIPMIMNEIIAICKEDKVLFKHENLEGVEHEIATLELKIKKQKNLIEQSKELEKDLDSKLNLIENEIYSSRETLLEELRN